MTVEPTAASQRRHTLWLAVIVIAGLSRPLYALL